MMSSLLLLSESKVNLSAFAIDCSLTYWWSKWLSSRLNSLRRRWERNIPALKLSFSRILSPRRKFELKRKWSSGFRDKFKKRSPPNSVKRYRFSCFRLFLLKLISSLFEWFLIFDIQFSCFCFWCRRLLFPPWKWSRYYILRCSLALSWMAASSWSHVVRPAETDALPSSRFHRSLGTRWAWPSY